ncbi:splicing factor [Plasmodium gonderi]|uniref:Splicing factor subunit n=1 Tax=Plasmodium gonderi TaxID=77519 RepID=A0A1Y1JJ71_PLAGO|nr:splicing factor [Plasmodium gonderi]GAW81698.1 splicing factor [Plasmodium gonderi]
MSAFDRFNIHAQLEHLQSKYQGSGHSDTTRWEWLTNIHRDTLASHVGHYSRLAYFAIVENEPIAKIRYRCLQNMSLPIVPNSKKEPKQ